MVVKVHKDVTAMNKHTETTGTTSLAKRKSPLNNTRKDMKTKTFRFWWYNRTSQDTHTMDSSTKDKTWTMPTDEDCRLYAKYEATRIGAYRYEEIQNETD